LGLRDRKTYVIGTPRRGSAIREEKSMQDFESDLSSLSAKRDLDRRQMLATSLAVGFAAAVQPVCAQTAITTDSNGITAGEVKIPVQDGEIPAYRAMPAKGGPFPLILVVQEIFGVHEHIKDICRRLAKEGYMAIAAELYARQGSVAGMTDIQEIIGKVVSKVPDAQVMSDLDATAAYAKASGSADTARLGVTGFCWGGRITWLYAEHNPAVKAGVAWYGRLVGDPSPLTPKQPIDLVGDLKAPVLGLYGAADTGIPVDTIEKMRSACQAAGKICEFVIYPDTPHAFNADYRPSYREGPAKDGWARMLAWFRSHGVA
jgi:carboxymethylenebutenolidase